MKALRFKCRHCGQTVTDGKPGQSYCGLKACRAARKRAWRRERYASDPEYRLSQKESTDAWLEAQGGAAAYYRAYRIRKRRRKLESEAAEAEAFNTDAESKGKEACIGSLFAGEASDIEASANRDACLPIAPIISGTYELFPQGANRDAITVEIRMISSG